MGLFASEFPRSENKPPKGFEAGGGTSALGVRDVLGRTDNGGRGFKRRWDWRTGSLARHGRGTRNFLMSVEVDRRRSAGLRGRYLKK